MRDSPSQQEEFFRHFFDPNKCILSKLSFSFFDISYSSLIGWPIRTLHGITLVKNHVIQNPPKLGEFQKWAPKMYQLEESKNGGPPKILVIKRDHESQHAYDSRLRSCMKCKIIKHKKSKKITKANKNQLSYPSKSSYKKSNHNQSNANQELTDFEKFLL